MKRKDIFFFSHQKICVQDHNKVCFEARKWLEGEKSFSSDNRPLDPLVFENKNIWCIQMILWKRELVSPSSSDEILPNVDGI